MMSRLSYFLALFAWVLPLAAAIAPWAGMTQPASAMPSLHTWTLNQFTPTDPKNPASGAGGGTRPSGLNCLQPSATADSQLIALSPAQAIGQTLKARPDFWVYLPPTVATQVELSLSDRANHEQQVLLPLPQRTGWVKLPFPKQFSDLRADKTYTWSVALICNPQDRPQDWVVSGTVRYTTTSPQLLTLQDSDHDPISSLVRSQFLLDAMSLLEQQTPSYDRMEQAWQRVMQSQRSLQHTRDRQS
jgi:Domain of Unknown Function (DUF928)